MGRRQDLEADQRFAACINVVDCCQDASRHRNPDVGGAVLDPDKFTPEQIQQIESYVRKYAKREIRPTWADVVVFVTLAALAIKTLLRVAGFLLST